MNLVKKTLTFLAQEHRYGTLIVEVPDTMTDDDLRAYADEQELDLDETINWFHNETTDMGLEEIDDTTPENGADAYIPWESTNA